ncbi:MAG: 2-dehydropantoate 2-reductase [Firmicutes bacterium]|nr:2-dehydropantoate 2-reductase [Bacillota bacterium]
MRIYIDFDDCLCETGRALSKLAWEMFNKRVHYDQMRYFELDRSFDLDAEQYERLMLRVHEPEILLSFAATPGAVETINEWISCGHEVSIITGRPSRVYEPSRIWLDENGLQHVKLYCLNKYGRDFFIKNSNSTLELEDYYRMKFDYAVEDSPKAFSFFEHLPELKVLVFDRPWNRECAFPNGNYQRCADWESIRRIVAGQGEGDADQRVQNL